MTLACTACPAGSQCLDAAVSPVACVIGTYNSLTIQTTCTPCAAGYRCPTTGLEQPIACADGWYQETTTQSSCTECDAGSYAIYQ